MHLISSFYLKTRIKRFTKGIIELQGNVLQEHQRSQREQWEIRQLDNDLLQQRQSERERELKEAEQQRILSEEQDEFSVQST